MLKKFLVLALLSASSLFGQVLSGSGIVSSGNGITFGNPVAACVINTASLPGGTVGVSYGSQSILTTNCVAPLAWTTVSGALPGGLSLTTPTAGTTGTLSGTPTTAGTYAFTVQVTDANGKVGQQMYSSVIINPACHILTSSLPNGTQGVAYSQPIATNGCVNPETWTISSGALPPGVTQSGTTGALSGMPTTPGTYTFQTHVVDNLGNADTSPTLTIIIGSGATCAITTLSLPGGIIGQPYSAPITTTACTAPLTWGLAAGSGALPAGLNFVTPTAGTTGTIQGTPLGPATTSNFTAQVTDASSNVDTQALSITINSATGADNIYCGPSETWLGATTDHGANLPTACVYTPLSGTPAPGTVRGPDTTLAALQADVNAAACGDIIKVQQGSVFTGTLNLPAKNCDNAHWIWIESTGVSDPAFPPEGTRATPAIGGVASLPNRPSYSCTNCPTDLTFTIKAPASSNAVTTTSGDHYRFIGAQISRIATPGVPIYNLVDLSSSGIQANHIIFDRMWCHGINQDGNFPFTQAQDTSLSRCIYLGQSNHIAVIDSYLSDFYDTSAASANGNTDAQCFSGGVGGIAGSGWGAYKFVNNHCEGSAEAIILGGAGGPPLRPVGCTILVNCNDDAPSDVEVRRNYFFKPLSWNGNTTVPGGAGWPVVKNGWEMKTGIRMLFEGNVVENCWYNSQVCYTFSIAPVNQQSGGTPAVPTCPTCVIKDVTYRYNYGYNAAYGIGLYAFAPAGCASCVSQGANRVSVHDNLIGDNLNLGSLSSTSAGDEMEILAVADPTNQGLSKLTNINISNNTFVKGIRALSIFGGGPLGQMANFTVQNNIWSNANFGVLSINSSSSDCSSGAALNKLYAILNACVTTWTWDHNAVFNWNQGTLGSNWPKNGSGVGNFFYTSSTGPGFTNFNNANSGFNPANYQILSSSPLHNAGSNGLDVGADINTILTKISGVRQ